ncbi:EF-P beta-lysylation protein EpmB [Candidatus Endobugula sertula]|uniref:L-lysine 2,3-aminomutase n=1 Tax=Candidatus Endobugula sertula TaxID=62101 RepID=A0A1D2QRV9_9GAMM|nr:EF-P beta-lysylation protein EpmB [Candidatus Endobugula sertula]
MKNSVLATNTWQQAMQQCITSPEELFNILDLDPIHLPATRAANKQFPLRVPLSFIKRMAKGDINDPLLKQVLPIKQELQHSPGYLFDPVGEQQNPSKGIIYKYHGRALLIVNGHCAVNCRYCFRRHFPYADNRLSRPEWEQAISELAANPQISEVIYSGGDPLSASDRQLRWLTQKIAAISHIKRLRIHTRLPVVIPERITVESLKWMTESRLQTIVVLHINHSNELKSSELLHAIQRIKASGITLFNQAVLLKGVNDTEEQLIQLCESLFTAGVIPYYLYTLDKVAGATHFNTELKRARALHQAVIARLPGYMVPKLVSEVAGQPSKSPV